jgi:hypothetical protein
VIELRRTRWVGHVASTGDRKVHTGIWWRDLTAGDHLEELGINGRITLKWIFMKWDGEAWIGFISPRIGTSGGLL